MQVLDHHQANFRWHLELFRTAHKVSRCQSSIKRALSLFVDLRKTGLVLSSWSSWLNKTCNYFCSTFTPQKNSNMKLLLLQWWANIFQRRLFCAFFVTSWLLWTLLLTFKAAVYNSNHDNNRNVWVIKMTQDGTYISLFYAWIVS